MSSDGELGTMSSLSTSTAVGLCTLHTVLYLSSIYVLPSTRISSAPPPTTTTSDFPPAAPLTRNSPIIIRRRLVAVSLASLSSLYLLSRIIPAGAPPLLVTAGLSLATRSPAECARVLLLPLGLTVSLFSGSLLVAGLQGDLIGQAGWSWKRAKDDFGGWIGLRTYVIVRLLFSLGRSQYS